LKVWLRQRVSDREDNFCSNLVFTPIMGSYEKVQVFSCFGINHWDRRMCIYSTLKP
jgi:hypothetical protein